MVIGEIIFWIEIIVGITALILWVIRLTVRKEPYEFWVVRMRPGVNSHKVLRGSELEFETELDNKTIKIMPDRLYRIREKRLRKYLNKFYGIKQRFFIVYQKGKKEPIKPPSVAVSARILKQVNESRALGKSLSSEFSVPMDMKKILLVIGGILLVVISWYIVQMGGLPV